MKSHQSRRQFIKQTALLAGAVTMWPTLLHRRMLSAIRL